MVKQSLSRFRQAAARRLRQAATPPEQILWRALERVPTFDTHFRRQVPLGPYVADFVCHAARLIIELDGEQHGYDNERTHDAKRTKFLETQGYRVLRFWNRELIDNLEGVLDTIYAALYGSLSAEPARFARLKQTRHPTPALRADPPHQGEGKKSATSTLPSMGRVGAEGSGVGRGPAEGSGVGWTGEDSQVESLPASEEKAK